MEACLQKRDLSIEDIDSNSLHTPQHYETSCLGALISEDIATY